MTAISVGRECGMIPSKGKVIVTEAVPPKDGQPATINWQYADHLPAPEIVEKASLKVRSHFAVPGSLPVCTPPGLCRSGARGALSPQEILMLEDEEAPRPDAPETSYHFAISGKSFSVISEHFPDLLPKVGACARAEFEQLVGYLASPGVDSGRCWRQGTGGFHGRVGQRRAAAGLLAS